MTSPKPWETSEYREETEPGKQVQRWADNAMFPSPPLDKTDGPRVYLLSMTPDPLGTVAAVNHIYTGRGVKALSEITDEERRSHWQQILKTRLKAPFEFVKFHFFIEGVTRAFTHQMVRQRTATYAQESLRFAVVQDSFVDRVALPPSIAALPEDDRLRRSWNKFMEGLEAAYKGLVENGIPAEDARGLLPTNILTRLHYTTDLRALLDHAGNRLCTQAQFEWRQVWAQMIQAIREYDPYDEESLFVFCNCEEPYGKNSPHRVGEGKCKSFVASREQWQYQEISKLFKPICYQTGKCEFMSAADRMCNIRNRVQANHDIGRGSAEWSSEYDNVQGSPIVSGVGPHSVLREGDEGGRPVFIGAIQPVEWLADPTAARKSGGGHLGDGE